MTQEEMGGSDPIEAPNKGGAGQGSVGPDVPQGGTNEKGGYSGPGALDKLYQESTRHSASPFPVKPAFGREEKAPPADPHANPFAEEKKS